MRRVPFASILAEYRDRKLKEELASDWGSLVFYRMPSFVLAWALVPLGVTPNQLTLLGVLLIPAMAAACWFLPPEQAMWNWHARHWLMCVPTRKHPDGC
jgi:hypothetical protein